MIDAGVTSRMMLGREDEEWESRLAVFSRQAGNAEYSTLCNFNVICCSVFRVAVRIEDKPSDKSMLR